MTKGCLEVSMISDIYWLQSKMLTKPVAETSVSLSLSPSPLYFIYLCLLLSPLLSPYTTVYLSICKDFFFLGN